MSVISCLLACLLLQPNFMEIDPAVLFRGKEARKLAECRLDTISPRAR
jgi:hypothetical protein